MWLRDRSGICGAADGDRRLEAGPSLDGDGLARRRPGLRALRMALRAVAAIGGGRLGCGGVHAVFRSVTAAWRAW